MNGLPEIVHDGHDLSDVILEETITQLVRISEAGASASLFAKKHSLRLEGDALAFLIFTHEIFGKTAFLDDRTSENSRLHDAMRSIKHMVQDTLSSRHIMYYMRDYECLPVLINVRGKNPAENAIPELTEAVRSLVFSISEETGLSLKAHISGLHHGVDNIAAAYNEARVMARYREIMSLDDDILRYDDYDYSPFDNNLISTRSMEMHLYSSVRASDFNRAGQLIDRIAYDMFFAHPPSILMAEHHLSYLKSLMMGIWADLSALVSRDLLIDLDTESRTLCAKSVKDFLDEVKSILSEISDFWTRMSSRLPPLWIRDVGKYIDDNYRNPLINISTIADHFDLNADYLSRSFKHYKGIGILEQIHMLRLADARHYLSDGMPIATVAQMVGYGHERTMTRSFKKYEGITPGMLQRAASTGAGPPA